MSRDLFTRGLSPFKTSLSRRSDDRQAPAPTPHVAEILDVRDSRRSGLEKWLRAPTAKELLANKYDEETFKGRVQEAVAIELARIHGWGAYKRLEDHLLIAEATGHLAPQVADHFARVQAEMQDKIFVHKMAAIKKLQAQREMLEPFKQTSPKAYEREMKALDLKEEAMCDNLDGAFETIVSQAANDLNRTLQRLDSKN
jgi:hypothetical protein